MRRLRRALQRLRLAVRWLRQAVRRLRRTAGGRSGMDWQLWRWLREKFFGVFDASVVLDVFGGFWLLLGVSGRF